MSAQSRFQRLRWSAACALSLLVAGLVGGCSNPTVTTPTRTLDRPSDVALYCVDLEVPNCLPTDIDPSLDPEGYLAEYCNSQPNVDTLQPTATVLALEQCDDDHRRLRYDRYLALVQQAAVSTGRDPNSPCCPADNTTCGTPAPTCLRRTLSALISNTARGELAVADTGAASQGLATNGRLNNLHSGQPGYGFLPTGLLPEHVRSFSSIPAGSSSSAAPNAWAVTANTGSCDLSVVQLQRVANLAAQPNYCFEQNQWCPNRSCDENSCPQRVEPWLPGAGGVHRPLLARPAWIEIAPWSATSGRRAVIAAFPTCGVIAAIDLGDETQSCDPQAGCGQVSEAVGFDGAGRPRVLTASDLLTLSCAADCGSDSSANLMPDPKALPDGGAPRVAAYPATLAIDEAGQRLLIGDGVGVALTVVDLDRTAAAGGRFRGTPRRVSLDFSVLPESLRGGEPGLDSIRISPRSAAGQFAYLVARDSSVRVVDLDREVECETNPDPRYLLAHAGDLARVLPDELNDSNLRRLSCFPVGQTPRNPLATGAGIAVAGNSLPRDVGFVHVDANPCDVTDTLNCGFAPNADPSIWIAARTSLWVGDYAWLLGGGGTATAVQLADACPLPSYRACVASAAALRRVSFLSARSQAQPSPDLDGLPSFYQALTVVPTDRLANVRRTTSRFEDRGLFGPRTEADSTGLPTFSTRVSGTAVGFFAALSDPKLPAGRQRLVLPTPAPYQYLPVDPVCDVALESQGEDIAHRPISMARFTDPMSLNDQVWSLDWEGSMAGLARTTGNLQADGTLLDLNGLYCSRGVEGRDKLWLTGCQSDSDCLYGATCWSEASQGTAPGICLDVVQRDQCRAFSQQLTANANDDGSWAASWLRRYRIVKSEQQVRTSTGDTADRLTFDEIAEPEFDIERESCTVAKLGTACATPIVRFGRLNTDGSPSLAVPKCHVTGGHKTVSLETSCILECQGSQDCGVGFVCAHSRYEQDELASGLIDAHSRARCVRAPLIHPDTPFRSGGSWQPLGSSAQSFLATCFPNLTRYEIHAGDSFLVRGDRSGSPVLVRRATDGSCQRPAPGSAEYLAGRLLEPRLHLGPPSSLADLDPQRCPTAPGGWISHRVPPSAEALATPSCQSVRPAVGSRLEVPLPSPLTGSLVLRAGQEYPLTKDVALSHEFELLSSLPLESGRNQCILTGIADETYPKTAADAAACSGICQFPGDKTETLGVRRIHFETALGNLVLRLPRVLADITKPWAACDPTKQPLAACNPDIWSIPPEGYSVSFNVVGTLQTYSVAVQSAQRDVSSGLLAQGLRSATVGPSGALYIVDEGRSGALAGLRGQVLRIVGSLVDPFFLLR